MEPEYFPGRKPPGKVLGSIDFPFCFISDQQIALLIPIYAIRIMPKAYGKSEIYMGMVLMGATGLAIGWVIHSPLLMTIAGLLGLVIGGFIGWLGGRRYMFIICLGILIGAFFGYRTGDQDILIIAAGSGGAIAGFMGAQIEQFFTTGRGGNEQ